MMAETCLRVTPSAEATSVIVNPRGFRYISSRISPGCARACIVSLVVVGIIIYLPWAHQSSSGCLHRFDARIATGACAPQFPQVHGLLHVEPGLRRGIQ